MPVAPGTWGALPVVGLWGVLVVSGADIWTCGFVMVAVAVGAGVLNVALGPWAVNYFGRKDPRPVVLDEVAGQAVALIGLPIAGGAWIFSAGSAFLIGRALDIIKPPPARQAEKLPHGWGILTDDLVSGLYANLVCQLLLRILLPLVDIF